MQQQILQTGNIKDLNYYKNVIDHDGFYDVMESQENTNEFI